MRELAGTKAKAAHRWFSAIDAEGSYGHWEYTMARKPEEVRRRLDEATRSKCLTGEEL